MHSYVSRSELFKYYEAIKTPTIGNKVVFYHYTSTEVLDKILETATFWASNLYYLNDSSEFKAGISWLINCFSTDGDKYKEVIEYLNELEKNNGMSWEGIYTISFSTECDELQQWITYAKESGICIELGSYVNGEKDDIQRKRLMLTQKEEKDAILQTSEDYHGFGRLKYIGTENEMEENANTIYHQFVDSWDDIADVGKQDRTWEEMRTVWKDKPVEAKRYLALLASYYKVGGFEGEKEIRISFYPIREEVRGKIKRTKIEYVRLSTDALRPYIKIAFWKGDELNKPKVPIKSIYIGPSGNQQSVYESVVHRLEYGVVNIWPFSLEEKVRILKQYVDGCFRIVADEDNSKFMRNDIALSILKDWCERTDGASKTCFFKAERENRDEYDLSVSEEKIQFTSVKVPTDMSEEQKEKIHKLAQKYIHEYYKNEYITKDGICVRKSKIPYIF